MVDEVFALKQGHSFPEIGDAIFIVRTWVGPKYQYIAMARSERRSVVGFEKKNSVDRRKQSREN